MRKIGLLFLALVLGIFASLATPPPSHSAEVGVFCTEEWVPCVVNAECDAYCLTNCPETPRGICLIFRVDGFCTCGAPTKPKPGNGH